MNTNDPQAEYGKREPLLSDDEAAELAWKAYEGSNSPELSGYAIRDWYEAKIRQVIVVEPLLSINEISEASYSARNRTGNFHDGFAYGAKWACDFYEAKIASGELIVANNLK